MSNHHFHNWNWEKARHLLFRAGFGGKPEEIETALDKGLSTMLEAWLSGPPRPLPTPKWLAEDQRRFCKRPSLGS